MSVFFNGRLYTSPTTASRVDDSALANQNLDVGNNLAILGLSVGGAPNTPLVFGSPSQAQAALIDGELLDAVLKAFSPSTETGGPAQVTAIRVNPALQSSLTLNNATPAAAINLVSTDYGAYTNQIKVKVETGSVQGKRLTTQYGTAIYTQDNIYKALMSILYSGGQASAQMTISATSIVLAAPTGTTVATVDLTVYQTLQQVVDYINTIAGFAASVLGGFGTTVMANGLDFITAQDVKTALYTVTGTLQACVDWLNSSGDALVTATRAAAGLVPANIPFTYLSGGSDGTVTNTQWSNAYTELQLVDVQWVVPVTSNPAIHAMNDAHCVFMSTVMSLERRGFVGAPLGTTDASALTLAMAINSDRTGYLHLGHYAYDNDPPGLLTLYPPYMTAAILGGMFAGSDPGTPMTNKSISVQGLERLLRNPTDTDPLITGGVLCVESTKKGFKVVKSNSSWLTNDNYDKVEISTGAAVDFMARNVRDALDVLRGQRNNPLLLSMAVQITESTLRLLAVQEPQGPGVLVGDADSPAYQNITATIAGDVINVQYQAAVVIPANFILVSIFAVPFSGSASAA